MSRNKDYEMAIKIAGEIEKSFYESTRLTKKELREIAKQAALSAKAAEETSGSLTNSIQKGLKDAEPAFTGLENAAKASFKAIAAAATTTGVAIGAGLYASIGIGSEFESAFAGVKKTVTASDKELAQMREEIRQMAKEMPSTAAELSEIAEAAGQLDIHPENIVEFTETMANMEVATNLARDAAATNFAQFANIVDMPQDKFDELGSSVVALGNNMAATESDIVSMGMKIAAAGDQVQLSEADIMGYAASLSSVGIEAEAGGSAFSKLLVNMQLAAETGKNLEQYAKVAGKTGQEFKQAFQEDASTAINAFLSGLNDTERNGKSAIAVLTDMGITEVRLRDTLLRAANASDLFENALGISNDAWEENMALANEAAQYYATFENQCNITENKLKDIGISVYDDLRPGLTEAMMLANDFIDSMAGQEDVIGKMIDSAVESMPTMVREVKKAGNALGEFAEPFLTVGKWLAENPEVIVGAVTGIGTALATYKIASGVMSIVSALSSLPTTGWAIMGIAGVAAVITGIGASVKKSAAEAKKANLDKHFGNIALSMKDIQEAASYIIKNESLEKVQESFNALSELDGISDEINDATEAINKMNWKGSLGMEFTDQEKQEYQSQVETLVQSTQDYLNQQQYAVTLSVTALLGDDLENTNIVTELNEFYADKQQELADLGTDLNNVITDAFQDGLLDIPEIKEIQELQQDIAHIKSVFAESKFDAGLDLIGTKYSGQSLDADSFQNLQAEIQSQVDDAMTAYDENYVEAISAYRMLLSEGEISEEAFKAEADRLRNAYLQQKMDVQAKAVSYQIDAISQAYGDELSGLLNQLDEETNSQLSYLLEYNVDTGGLQSTQLDFLPDYIWDGIEIDKTTRGALEDLVEQMQPALVQMEELEQQYKDAGLAVPEALREGLYDVRTISALTGDMDALWGVIEYAAGSEEYQDAITALVDAGVYLPEPIAEAIEQNQYKIDDAVAQSAQETQAAYAMLFGQKEFNIPINYRIVTDVDSSSAQPYYKNLAQEYIVNTGHKEGGIFTKPHVAWFAEEGMEAAIPIDGSSHAIELWQKTGELLGIKGLDEESLLETDTGDSAYYDESESSPQFYYSPTLQFYGEAPSREDIESILETEQEKFARMMEQYLKNNRRVKFS